MIKYPEIKVQLSGNDGNAFMILGNVDHALMRGGVDKAERDEFQAEATQDDYDHLLQTCMRWVTVG